MRSLSTLPEGPEQRAVRSSAVDLDASGDLAPALGDLEESTARVVSLRLKLEQFAAGLAERQRVLERYEAEIAEARLAAEHDRAALARLRQEIEHREGLLSHLRVELLGMAAELGGG
jgi:chromosome segregation ATPase